MISIYDVLKASKGLPVRDPIACHWGRKLGGGAAGYGELTGTPPLTFVANGGNLINYRIYGANGGVGEQTNNLYDKNTDVLGYYITNSGTIAANSYFRYSSAIIVTQGDYTLCNIGSQVEMQQFTLRVAGFNENGDFISIIYSHVFRNAEIISPKITIPAGITSIKISYRYIEGCDPGIIMLTEGSTAPAQYIPYGYQINAEVGDGATTTGIPIYIGDTPLAQGEYVDYGEQKVYKYVGGVLTPTEPPVELPALPTIDGTTVADFDNEPKPSEMYIKYPK